jgi:hypothetical protein
MNRESNRKRLPPYISYRTFQNFIDRLQQGIPSRIDRSFWDDRLSGSSGTQLMSALRFFSLVDVSGIPTSLLRELVGARAAQKKDVLKRIITESFDFLNEGSIDLQTATYSQLEEAFEKNFELTESVKRKCVKFFVSLAIDTGIPLSQFITRRLRSLPDGTGTKPAAKRKPSRTKTDNIVTQENNRITDKVHWDKMILDKFPTFDPAWSDEVKLKWFSAFDKLLERNVHKDR